jgi:phosphoribosylformimino-5-aminoimidazole carboxamide ribotide isomerase
VEIIPVIDLMQGQVVHARMGEREHYQPIVSSLCTSSKPLQVLDALLELYPFNKVYIADLDAIQGSGNHIDCINQLATTFPTIQFWLDAGVDNDSFFFESYAKNIRFIIGSENLSETPTYIAIEHKLAGKQILSLDVKGLQLLGPPVLHHDASYWPADVIGMQLSQVGSGLGVNTILMSRLQTLNQLRGSPSKLYAAGGARNIADCEQLRQEKVSGVLVATALHSGAISSEDLGAFYSQ